MTPRPDQVTNRGDEPPPAPVRRSLKERMASARPSFADPLLTAVTGNPLTQTHASLVGMTTTEHAFQIAPARWRIAQPEMASDLAGDAPFLQVGDGSGGFLQA